MTHDHIAIIQGRAADYDALARFHYRAPRPAVCVRTLTACDQSTGEVVGVLTVSMPTLNGPWAPLSGPASSPTFLSATSPGT